MLYKVGDIVRVRDDIVLDRVYISEDGTHRTVIGSGKIKLAGRRARIAEVKQRSGKYVLQFEDESGNWTDPYNGAFTLYWVADTLMPEGNFDFEPSKYDFGFLLGGD